MSSPTWWSWYLQNNILSKEVVDFLSDIKFCDLGSNSLLLVDLVKKMKSKRFLDLGVRNGASSAALSVNASENNNQVYGCDLNFAGLTLYGEKFVSENYVRCQADSVTLGKNWNDDPLDIIFVDTLHTREIVLAELYFWSKHINESGYFVFHDSHWDHTTKGDMIAGKEYRRVDEAITEFFNLPKNVMELTEYEDDDIFLTHHQGNYGMTFVKIKTLNAIERFKDGIDWVEVFNLRNELSDLHFNKNNPKFINWEQDIPNIQNELIITP